VRRNFQLNGQDSILYLGAMSQVQAIQNAAKANVYGIQAGVEVKLPSGFRFASDLNFQKGEEELDNGTKSASRHAAPFFGISRFGYANSRFDLEVNVQFSDEVSYKNLAEEIIRVLYPENLTYKLNLNITNQQFIFNVYEPVDRTYTGASVSEKVLFGVRFGNMSTYNRTLNNLQEKNHAYVGGQGEEELRTIVEVSNVTNRRKEIFVDARDVDTTGELTERGGQSLAELQSIDNLEFEIIERQYQYETNFDLGDIVTIVYGQSEYYDRQIIRIVETYEKGQNKVECEFGITPQTLSKQLRQFNSKLTIISTR
jgi:hypothetical protein